MRLRELISEVKFSDQELEKRWGPLDPEDRMMVPDQGANTAAVTPWSCYAVVTTLLGDLYGGDGDEVDDPAKIIVYATSQSGGGKFIPDADSGGGAIELPDLDSHNAADVAIAAHEAFHALVWKQVFKGGGQVFRNEKIVNRLAEKWVRNHLHGMAQHVGLEAITGSRISYGHHHVAGDQDINTVREPRPDARRNQPQRRPPPAQPEEPLTELFDRSLPLEWQTDGTYTSASAYDRQGRLIEISFTQNDEGMMDLEFQRGGSRDTTGHGDENLVFGTVITAVREYMNKRGQNVTKIYFGGAADRQKLYQMLATRLGQEYGFHRAAKPTGSVFKMIRNP